MTQPQRGSHQATYTRVVTHWKKPVGRKPMALEVTVTDTDADLAQVRSVIDRALTRWQDAHRAERAIAEVLTGLDETPSERTLRGLLAHELAWRELTDQWGAWSSTEVAAITGNRNRNPHDWATAQVRAGKLLAVQRGGRYVYPGYQFHPRHGTPSAAMATILPLFREAGWDDDSIALWFTGPQGSADGAIPAELLHEHPSRVIAAATSSSAG